MNQIAEGFLSKMSAELRAQEVQYFLDLNPRVEMNLLLGKNLQLTFTGQIACVGCGRAIKKTFQQGYCFPCVKAKAACDLCIVKPELCHFHKGTCREPDWGQTHCMQKHVVYLANTSGLKVGITRFKNVPQRFIDQGATQALPVFEVDSRYHSGLIEVKMAEFLQDKTNWRKMLQGDAEDLDLLEVKTGLADKIATHLESLAIEHDIQLKAATLPALSLKYPVLTYPTKITSFNFDKNPTVEGELHGIKGQYLLLSTGVINLRKFSGYHIRLSALPI